MSGGGVQIVIELFAVLAVIALVIGQPEQALLEDRITFVPQGEGQAKSLVVIGKSGDAILAPSIGATTGMVVGQILPRIAVLAVVFTYRPPLALAKIGTPLSPKSVLGFITLSSSRRRNSPSLVRLVLVMEGFDRLVVPGT